MTAKTPIQLFRERATQGAAVRQYALAHDAIAEKEQRAIPGSQDAALLHSYALIALRAYRAEVDDPAVAESRVSRPPHGYGL